MAAIVLSTGKDFARKFRLKLDGAAEDVSTYTIECSVKNAAKTSELIPDTAQTNTGGAAWASGEVIIRFPASATTGLTPQDAWIETTVFISGEKFHVDDIPIVIETGYTL